jgi:hypothetical protein
VKISREDAEKHLRAGRPVAFYPDEGAPRTLDPPAGRRAGKRERVPLPAEDAEGQYLLLRDEKGALTRAGMEHAIRTGGAVMHDGDVIESVDDLPSEAELARGDERRTEQVRQSLDAQMAALAAQRAALDREEEEEEEEEEEPEGEGGPDEGAARAAAERRREARQRAAERRKAEQQRPGQPAPGQSAQPGAAGQPGQRAPAPQGQRPADGGAQGPATGGG